LFRGLGTVAKMKYIIHFMITIIALMFAVILLPGMYIQGTNPLIAFALTALILGLVNIFLRPLMTLISFGCIVFSLGLFLLVINAAILWISAWICLNWLHIGFHIDSLWTALWGSLIVSIVSFIFSLVFRIRE